MRFFHSSTESPSSASESSFPEEVHPPSSACGTVDRSHLATMLGKVEHRFEQHNLINWWISSNLCQWRIFPVSPISLFSWLHAGYEVANNLAMPNHLVGVANAA